MDMAARVAAIKALAPNIPEEQIRRVIEASDAVSQAAERPSWCPTWCENHDGGNHRFDMSGYAAAHPDEMRELQKPRLREQVGALRGARVFGVPYGPGAVPIETDATLVRRADVLDLIDRAD